MRLVSNKRQIRRVLVPRTGAWLVAAGAVLFFSGCQRDEVTHVRVPKGSPMAGSGIVPPLPRAPGGDRPAAPTPSGPMTTPDVVPQVPLKWTLPQGWTEKLNDGMRFATIKGPGDARFEVTVVVLRGAGGGELANVNRWRGQVGLPEFDDGALALARQRVESKAGTLALFDFSGEIPARARVIVGLLAFTDGNTWFIKMAGDAEPVGTARADFIHLLESLHFD